MRLSQSEYVRAGLCCSNECCDTVLTVGRFTHTPANNTKRWTATGGLLQVGQRTVVKSASRLRCSYSRVLARKKTEAEVQLLAHTWGRAYARGHQCLTPCNGCMIVPIL